MWVCAAAAVAFVALALAAVENRNLPRALIPLRHDKGTINFRTLRSPLDPTNPQSRATVDATGAEGWGLFEHAALGRQTDGGRGGVDADRATGLGIDQRQLADSLAKGKIAITIGLSYYTFAPFLKAGLPVKPLPDMKEGTYTSCGSSATSVVKNSPHPNATKVFINWLLSKEGQELYGKAMGQATRRLDVDTKWMVEHGVRASKDFLTIEENNRLENYGEDTINNYWAKSTKIAEEVFK